MTERDKALEEAAALADDFSWVLPMFESRELNEVSDDVACEVSRQIGVAIRKLKSTST